MREPAAVRPPAAAGVPHAASRALGATPRRLPGDYERAFGVRLVAVESFTYPAAQAGTVYKACGFTAAGQTAGYGRSRGAAHYVRHGQPKMYWLRELVTGGAAALKAGFDTHALTGRRAPDFNQLRTSGDGGLLEYLAKVADHRKPKGIRHQLAAILAVVVVARLSGADSVYAAAQFAQTMPQEALRRCGIRDSTRLGRRPAWLQDDQAGRPQRRCRSRRQAAVRLAARRGRGLAELAAHRRRRQGRPRRRPPRRHPPPPAVRLRRHRRHRPGPGRRRRENQ